MSVVVIEPPEDLPVTLAAAKQQCRVDDDDSDDLITSLIQAAVGMVDGPSGWLGRALVTQTLEMRGEIFPAGDIALLYPPIAAVTAVTYVDAAGVTQTVAPGDYVLVGSEAGPRLAPAYGKSWPSVRYGADAVRVRYQAGWPIVDDVWTGPAAIRHAVLLATEYLFLHRGDGDTRDPFAGAGLSLLQPYRIY